MQSSEILKYEVFNKVGVAENFIQPKFVIPLVIGKIDRLIFFKCLAALLVKENLLPGPVSTSPRKSKLGLNTNHLKIYLTTK